MLPAFPLVITATQGRTLVWRRGFERVVVPGHPLVIAPFEAIDLCLDGGATQPACCCLELQLQPPGSMAGTSLHHRISRRVFVQPQHAWSAAFIADLLRGSPAQVRRTLFSEGAALTELCRTQRLMRVLFEVLADGAGSAELRRRTGWSPRNDLEAAFYDWFGLPLHAIGRLGRGRAAIATSRAPTFVPHWPEQQLA
ncbi:AraC family transcriptional regulator [Cupriavidus basilensis]